MKFKSYLFDLLEEKAKFYNQPSFISSDPVSIPHQFSLKEDIEIAGFFAATIAWGNRTGILKNANRLIQLMDHQPYQFITQSGDDDKKRFSGFVHRTFNDADCLFFIEALSDIYRFHGGMEAAFANGLNEHSEDVFSAITHFREVFLTTPHLSRSEKHLANPAAGSSAKRINMFLRWMVRKDDCGVDFGLWNSMSPAQLLCPLDIHSGTVARKLGLLHRKQNDWKSVIELTETLREFDPSDPAKYDFALFGMGIDKL